MSYEQESRRKQLTLIDKTSHDLTDYSAQTREIYHKQHVRVAGDKKTMKRFISMFSYEYFGVKKDFFKYKKILDAGCGDTAKLLISLYKLGARDLTGLELGTDFIPVAQQSLKNWKVPLDAVKFTSGNVVKLPYPDESFDFVACHGVLIHLNNMEEVTLAIHELARVTKKGGYLYMVFGNTGGLFEDTINPAIRKYYAENKEFHDFIDDIKPKDFDSILKLVNKVNKEQTGKNLNIRFFSGLFDTDLCVTIQNVIQAPVRLKVTEDYVLEQYAKNGFDKPRRLRRFITRFNIRKYFAPLHYERNNPISKILYGSGNLEFMARKFLNL